MQKKDKIIGRSKEFARLCEVFDLAREGKGGIILIAGEAGIGKTCLAEEALAEGALPVFTGRATEISTPPYGPITAALRDCLRKSNDNLFEETPLSHYLALLLPELGTPPEEVDRETLVEAITTALTTGMQHKPAALFIDDLHWADEATLELLPILANRICTEHILILATYRSDEIPRGHRLRWLRNELRRTRQLQEIQLDPLGYDYATMLMENILCAPPSPALAQRIFDQTQGVPLFVEEMANALLTSGGVYKGETGFELVEGAKIPIPENIRDAVLIRLDVLSEEARRLLEVAAVAGTEFDLEMITELCGEETGLDELIERNFIVENRPGNAAFRHALTREAVLGEISWSRRRHLHRQIALYLETTDASPGLIAEHWLTGNALERARQALLESAEHSCQLHAYRDAAKAAHRALEIWPDGEEENKRLETLERLAHCAQVSGQLSDAVRALREVVECLPENESNRLGEVQRALATVYGLQGAWEQSMEARIAAAHHFEKANLDGEAAVEWLAAAGRYTATVQYTTALATVESAIRLAEKSKRPDVQARALALQGNVLAMLGKGEEGRQTIQAGLSLALKHNLTEAASQAYYRLALALEYASEIPAAREAFFTAYDYCENQGAEMHAQICLGCMAYVFYRSGEWKRALEGCKKVMENKTSPPDSRAGSVGLVGLIRAHRGETRPARKHLLESLHLARQANAVAIELIDLGGLAVVSEYEGDVQTADAYYRETLDLWQKGEDRHDAIAALCSAATFFANGKFEKETARCAEILATIATATGNTEALAALGFALGETELLHGNAEKAAGQFAQALSHIEKLQVPFERARFAYRTGVAYARAGDTEHAIPHLRNAYRLARKLGARPLATKIADEMEAFGETTEERRSPEASTRSQSAGLTQRQLEIARLMADGLTNKEIAQKLFLSPRTVDMHVSHILARLDCRSRTEAVRKAAELGVLG